MRIIKEGKIPDVERQLECGYCKTLFGFLPKDLLPPYVVNRQQRNVMGIVPCPLCSFKMSAKISDFEYDLLKFRS